MSANQPHAAVARGIAEGVLEFVQAAAKVLHVVALAAVAFLGALDFLA